MSVSRILALLPFGVLFLLPLAAALAFMVPGLLDAAGFAALLDHPQLGGAVFLTVFTGLLSTAVSTLLAFAIVAAAGGRDLARRSAVFLAVPHLALAIGLAFVIMPSGMLARLIAPLFAWIAPPQWVTTQDPWGLSLTLALILKETPFLVWAIASLLNRDDMRRALEGQTSVARSLGHGPASTFLRVIAPQILPRLVGPLIAVLAYSLTVVDMAIVIGPGQPPTLAQLVWTDLNDADPAMAARGGAGVLVLSGLVLLVLFLVTALLPLLRPLRHALYTGAPRQDAAALGLLRAVWPLFFAIYAVVMIVMLVQSVAAQWPFPALAPTQFTAAAWLRLVQEAAPFLTTLALALATSIVSLAAAVTWLEWASPQADSVAVFAAVLALCLPSLLLGLGQYRLFLALGITGTATALFIAHVVPVAAYVFLLLMGPYRAFDPRWQAVTASLSASRMRYFLRIKAPMLRAPLLAATATGFAVSVAQFVPAQLAAAGRYATLPMEAVTLSSGGNRPLIATYGLALMLLPLIVFLLAGWFGQPRWRQR